MTNMDDRYSILDAIAVRDPSKKAYETKAKTFKAGEQATTTKKKLPKKPKRKRTNAQRSGIEEEAPHPDDPFVRYHIPKTTCAKHDIPMWIAEHEEDPAFNVSSLISLLPCYYLAKF